MLLVIFGAGASYDSVNLAEAGLSQQDPDCPPLAKDLFDKRPLFTKFMNDFEPMLDVVGELRQRLLDGENVEAVLEDIQNDAKVWTERNQHLAAIRFYLRAVIRETTARWREKAGGITNYRWLKATIQRWCEVNSETVTYVTFNYDTLLEQALSLIPENIEDYVADPVTKVIKVHGSVDWAQVVEPIGNSLQTPHALIQNWPGLTFGDYVYRPSDNVADTVGGLAFAPAIAIPVVTKASFVCPDSHIAAVREAFRNATRLLIIGWRGIERYFQEEWSANLHQPKRSLIVAGDAEAGRLTNVQLSRLGLGTNMSIFEFGFTELRGSPALNTLLYD